MTVIVGITDKKKNVYIGGDSAGSNKGGHLRIRKDAKVFRNGEMIIGFTSSFRMGQLLRFNLKIPYQPKNMASDYEFMCTLFIDKVRDCLKKNGYAVVKDNEEIIGEFLVGYRGQIYHIQSDLQVGMAQDDFDACGAGKTYALGSLATNRSPLPEKIVLEALRVAEKFSMAVSRPFKIVKLKFK